jgi:hypothetical protein
MATARTKEAAEKHDDDGYVHDALIDAAEQAEAESGGVRNLFDLRMIIGGLFTFYGIYLTIRGVIDSSAAITQAAGVRINLWTGLAALVIGLSFITWAVLRPLTIDEIVEGQAASVEEEQAHDSLREEREHAARHGGH